MSNAKNVLASKADEDVLTSINNAITNYYKGEVPPITCSLQEAATITGIPYEQLLEASKIQSTNRRIPGFRIGRKAYRVLIGGLPMWILGLSKR